MGRPAPTLDVLTEAEAAPAATLLARAFADSPAYDTVFAHLSAPARLASLARVKRGFVSATMRHGASKVARVDGELAGVSLVLPPGAYPLSCWGELRQASGCATTGPTAIGRFLRLSGYLRKRHVRGPHHYLFVLGVEPTFQGRGIGKALLADLHAEADAAGSRCYLETEKELNVKLYEAVGYRVATDETVPGLPSLRMWTMVRPSRR